MEAIRRAAWVEVNLDAIAQNTRELRRLIPESVQFMAVVKANAYGHGAIEVSRVALANGADWLGVAVLDEALDLRKVGINAPILILGSVPEAQAATIVQADLRQTVFSYPLARALSQAAQALGKTARIHLKVDSGMGRIGFQLNADSLEEIRQIRALPGLEIEGFFSHLATADSADKAYAIEQFRRQQVFCQELEASGLTFPLRHLANSAALLDLPSFHLNMVRAGISLYGLYPSPAVRLERLLLQPALALKAQIVQVKAVPAGTAISYGRTHITPKATQIASLPLGYADGYPRVLSNRGEVLIRGQRAPLVGTVCMDQFMVDVGHIPEVQVGDVAVVLGEQEEERISAEEIARLADTINYEIVTRIGLRLPKVFLN